MHDAGTSSFLLTLSKGEFGMTFGKVFLSENTSSINVSFKVIKSLQTHPKLV